MVSDSITTAPIPSAANAKNLGKKKRTNRTAKLKQCKIDARREQWLSQVAVKNKGCKDGGDDGHAPSMSDVKDSKRSWEKLEMRPRGEENDGSMHRDGYLESPSNSPTSVDSSMLSADALAADDKHQNPCSELPSTHEPAVQMVSPREMSRGSNLGARNSKTESDRLVPWVSSNTRAWRPDDAFRPQSLPNLSKQHSLPNPDRRFGGVPWAFPAAPSPCPICCEDLDLTDSSFLPCLCGFRLCLFCHKRIVEEDGRCPGCRKPYERKSVEPEASVPVDSLTLRLARSCSMV
ncbi:43kDa postsynaptic protein [Senna tora]|uniref:43kDa postsynaptic protein n=1 Tax=Senna tora TaxID=362788 RepID=A0A834X4U4_9FABA|nr:43kDa postsynaptic protein [Senna tora]